MTLLFDFGFHIMFPLSVCHGHDLHNRYKS